MNGSVDDAQDLVQETYVRTWRAVDRFEERSSGSHLVLYRIATTCAGPPWIAASAVPCRQDWGQRRPSPYAPADPASGDVPVARAGARPSRGRRAGRSRRSTCRS